MNFCMHCGAKLPAEAQFCPSCGTRVHPDEPDLSVDPDPSDQRAVARRIMAALPAAETRPDPGGFVPKAKCPTCQSGTVLRQSDLKRGAKLVAFGAFAALSVAKTFKCTTCGYTW